MYYKKNIVLLCIIAIIAFFLIFLDIKVCLFHNIFKIPCASCGMTRAYSLILEGSIIESFKYNILAFPLLILVILVVLFLMFDKQQRIIKFTKKYKLILIIIAGILSLISFIININNPLLY